MKLTPKKIESIQALPAPKRYSHFIKVAADQRQVWGLYSSGWAMIGTDDGRNGFPLWPAAEYAQLCAVEEWKDYSPRSIDLDTLMRILVPRLKESGDCIAIFPTPAQKGILPDIDVMESDIQNELNRIE